MRDLLAQKLLIDVLDWSQEEVTKERPELEALAQFKYDEYQQFAPGMRFIENLAIWLSQFETTEERRWAYKFIKSQLIFISSSEIKHFVSMVYPDYIYPEITKEAIKKYIDLRELSYHNIKDDIRFKILLRQCLFLGLSDGAHIDIFRRENPIISHEQVYLTYEIAPNKADELQKKLSTDIKYWIGDKNVLNDNKFQMLFLLDDFTASGNSYARQKTSGEYTGKIIKVLKNIYEPDGSLKDIIKKDNCKIYVIFYIATTKAIKHIEKYVNEWFKNKNIKQTVTIIAIQELGTNICYMEDANPEFTKMLIKYFNESIKDEHYSIGNCEKPYLGFDQCGLSIILSHNTPNNSLPILWFEDNDRNKYRGLFPRVSRHKGEL